MNDAILKTGAQAPTPGAADSGAFRQPWLRTLKLAARDAVAAALLPLARLREERGQGIAVLSYHRVLPDFPAGSARSAVVSPSQFEFHLWRLIDLGFTTLSLRQFEEIAAGRVPCPPRAALITFDDAYADNYFYAFKLGANLRARLNFFLPTGIVGMERWPFHWGERTPQEAWHMARHPELWRPLNWDEVRRMKRGGASFGCHGYMHRRLSTLHGAELEEEVGSGLERFEEALGEPTAHFSIPWGEPAAYHDEALASLRAHGCRFIYTTTPRRLRLPLGEEALIPRLSVREQDGPAALTRKLIGAHDLMYELFGGVKK